MLWSGKCAAHRALATAALYCAHIRVHTTTATYTHTHTYARPLAAFTRVNGAYECHLNVHRKQSSIFPGEPKQLLSRVDCCWWVASATPAPSHLWAHIGTPGMCLAVLLRFAVWIAAHPPVYVCVYAHTHTLRCQYMHMCFWACNYFVFYAVIRMQISQMCVDLHAEISHFACVLVFPLHTHAYTYPYFNCT